MICTDFQDKKLPLLGFGAMRLPMDGDQIDEPQVARMVDFAMEHGVNYFDTAYPYHGGESERVMGRVLSAYPRESYYLATKYPGHQIFSKHDPAFVFEDQLEKCGVDYFDFYLLHNVNEMCIDVYEDPRWGIIDYFIEQKKKGRIRHLGFSTHGILSCMDYFLNKYGEYMEFCQIQLNYVDWTLQKAKEKCELLAKYNVPVWVMEPLRGGKLASLSDAQMEKLSAFRPDETAPGWAFRFLQGIGNVQMILSGMSSFQQMQENVQTFSKRMPLSAQEEGCLMEIAEELKNAVPCTACRYCCEGCPQGLDIPRLLSIYNDFCYASSINITIAVEALGADKGPGSCIGCGKCAQACPQGIDIPAILKAFSDRLDQQPSWAEISRQREEAQERSRKR